MTTPGSFPVIGNDYPDKRGNTQMNREILKKDVSMDSSIASAPMGPVAGRNQRVPDLRTLDLRADTPGCEESLVIDERCDLTPAQMVESKLTRVLGGSTLLVSHLQMRGLLLRR